MANNFRNPWVLDTTGSPVKSGLSIIKGLTLRGYSTSGHKAVFQDGAGRTVAELVGVSDLSPVAIAYTGCFEVNDLSLTTLDSGQVVVDVE